MSLVFDLGVEGRKKERKREKKKEVLVNTGKRRGETERGKIRLECSLVLPQVHLDDFSFSFQNLNDRRLFRSSIEIFLTQIALTL